MAARAAISCDPRGPPPPLAVSSHCRSTAAARSQRRLAATPEEIKERSQRRLAATPENDPSDDHGP
eukprot:7453813-Pyramimonas_sp.AAC.1